MMDKYWLPCLFLTLLVLIVVHMSSMVFFEWEYRYICGAKGYEGASISPTYNIYCWKTVDGSTKYVRLEDINND